MNDDDDELDADVFFQVFRALRQQAVNLSDSFGRSMRERIDELAEPDERRAPSLMRVLMSVVFDATNLIAGFGSAIPEDEEKTDD